MRVRVVPGRTRPFWRLKSLWWIHPGSPELIELYRAKRYESIQEALAAGPENVLKMSFHGKKIGSLSPEIKNFTYLATLDIANNDLAELPDELSDMHYLQSFYANGNRLTEFPGQLLLLPVLVRLDLSANQISEVPREIMKMDQLASLNLEANQLTGIPVQLYETQQPGSVEPGQEWINQGS
jgi:hypothetical protein